MLKAVPAAAENSAVQPAVVLQRVPQSRRARLRSQILQVSSDEDPFKDPFGDGKSKSTDPKPSEPEQVPQQPKGLDELPEDESSAGGVPAQTTPGETLPSDTAPEAMPAPQSSDILENAAGAVVGCEADKKLCAEAMAALKKNQLSNIDLNIVIVGAEGKDFPCECTLEGEEFKGRAWCETIYTWKASGLCHKPLYFEDVALERYGHSHNPIIQPFASAAHFFCSVPLLPYKMGLNPPEECVYTLGYYRPGSCAPYLIDPIPLSLRGALFQAGAIVGGVVLIP